MIEKILNRILLASASCKAYELVNPSMEDVKEFNAYKKCYEIVQEVAKEHRKLNRCDTCNHYVADEVPPICYFCCKGMEDNYQQKGE